MGGVEVKSWTHDASNSGERWPARAQSRPWIVAGVLLSSRGFARPRRARIARGARHRPSLLAITYAFLLLVGMVRLAQRAAPDDWTLRLAASSLTRALITSAVWLLLRAGLDEVLARRGFGR
jgi:hypothetical protein